MFITKVPDFIYDHNIKAVGINDQNGLRIYSNEKMPKFISDYWASWFGYKQAKIFESKLNRKDRLYVFRKWKNCIIELLELLRI